MSTRTLVAVGAAFAGAVHLSVALASSAHDHTGETAWVDAAMVAVGVALSVSALAALWSLRPARLIAAATALAYLASRTVGLPGHPPEGWDALGVLTTLVELGMVVSGADLRRLVASTRRARVAAAAGFVAVVGLPAVAFATGDDATPPAGCVPARRIELAAVELPRPTLSSPPRLAYDDLATTAPASTPGPLIEMIEGECIAITLHNRVSAATLDSMRTSKTHPLGVSLHVHGVKYTQDSDGTIGSQSYVPPGESRTYHWYAAPRTTVAGRVTSLGTAGYWWYHDHVVGTSHGTGGVNAGLWGGLIVRRAGDVKPDRTYVVGMGGPGPLLQLGEASRNQPGGQGIIAKRGERVEFLVIGIPGRSAAQDFHEFHLHGHNWADNRTGLLVGPADETRVVDAKVIGPSESFGFQVVAGEDVGPGHWMLHCHVQEHSDAGMSTFFRVTQSEVGAAVDEAAETVVHEDHAH